MFVIVGLVGSKPVKDAVGGYFRDLRGVSNLKGTDKYGAGDIATLRIQTMQQLKAELLRSIHRLDPLDKLKNQIEDPSNRRISVIVQYLGTDGVEATPPQIKNVQQVKELTARSSGLAETVLLRR
ncbi:MAG TPA: hypothetical protein VHY48_03020 [Acidobacteriaceae bacterium]|jgi:hypothetical protein|nr:hypothetical protein [Acidobacteriaceae bacterium]